MQYSYRKHLPLRAAQITLVTGIMLVMIATTALFNVLLFYSYP